MDKEDKDMDFLNKEEVQETNIKNSDVKPEHEHHLHEHLHKHHTHENINTDSEKEAWYNNIFSKKIIIPLSIIGLLIILILVFSWLKSPSILDWKSDKAKIDFYVMSQCPYGTQVEDAIKPVLDKFGNAVEFNLNFIGEETSPGKFQSLHGIKEVLGNTVQLCAAKYNPDKYMDMVVCMNELAQDIPENWEECAKDADINVDKVKKCYDGDEGKELLSESFKKSKAINAQGSPTIYINEKSYEGGRDELSFQRAICNTPTLTEHPECKNMPACGDDSDCTGEPEKIGQCELPNTKEAKCVYTEPVKITIKVLNDKNCKTCDTAKLTAVTKSIFLGALVEEVDVSTEEGKKLVQENKIVKLPAYLFEEKVADTYAWKKSGPQLTNAFEKTDDGYKLLDAVTGANYFVDESAREEFYKSIGVKLGDNKPQIDFFVMSYCPYGNQAEEAIKQVYDLLKDKAVFNPHYVIYENGEECYKDEDNKGQSYCSLHGGQELHQNVREACVKDEYGIADWFKFAIEMNTRCNFKNADTCWEKVAKDLGYDTDKIKKCEKDKAISLTKAEFVLGTKLGVGGSPQIFIDGVEFQGARSPEGYKQGLCNAFDTKPSECDTVLEGSASVTNSQAAAGGCVA